MAEQDSEKELFEILKSIKQALEEMRGSVEKINESLQEIMKNVSATKESICRNIEAMNRRAGLRQDKWNAGEKPEFFDDRD